MRYFINGEQISETEYHKQMKINCEVLAESLKTGDLSEWHKVRIITVLPDKD